MTRWNSFAFIAILLGECIFSRSIGAQPASSQRGAAAGTLRTVLANAALPSVVDVPRYFKAMKISVPAKHSTTYNGAVGFVFVLSGVLELTIGAERQLLRRGDANLVTGNTSMTLKANGSGPAAFLLLVLLSADELNKPMVGLPAVVTELYRTKSPIPGLKPGPYEFTLVRVTLPPRMPTNAPHHRSGAAMYYIFDGTGMFTANGKTEPKTSGSIHYEPYDLVHQWANPGDKPLVLIQANISQEGVPAVIFAPEAGTSAVK